MKSQLLELSDAHYSGQPLRDVMLLWTDPPYGTGKRRDTAGSSYHDGTDTAYVIQAIISWLPQMHNDGTVIVCCDYRLASDLVCAVKAYGWAYRGEIIWEFGLGRPRTSWWPVRHNNLLTFTRTEKSGLFDTTAVPRVKRLNGATKHRHTSNGHLYEYEYPETRPAGGVWDLTKPGTDGSRVGYPNEKPVEIIEPFVLAHTRPGDLVLDIFCGSSATGAAALRNGRHYVGIDNNPQAIAKSKRRLRDMNCTTQLGW